MRLIEVRVPSQSFSQPPLVKSLSPSPSVAFTVGLFFCERSQRWITRGAASLIKLPSSSFYPSLPSLPGNPDNPGARPVVAVKGLPLARRKAWRRSRVRGQSSGGQAEARQVFLSTGRKMSNLPETLKGMRLQAVASKPRGLSV